ncbi:hypothetical protein K501DRAFT_328742 [Backusella circina FSU 941]|nr:hypothetical protein K501DRAFT_328742 [Backusella circina FSU 941]
MICDTNWCTYCDNAINRDSDSLYCSENCLRKDTSICDSTLTNTNIKYPAQEVSTITSETSKLNSESSLPRLIRRKSSIPSLYCNHNSQQTVTAPLSSTGTFFSQCIPVSPMTPSLSSSISSSFSQADVSNQVYEELSATTLHHPKPQTSSYTILVQRLNRAIVDL